MSCHDQWISDFTVVPHTQTKEDWRDMYLQQPTIAFNHSPSEDIAELQKRVASLEATFVDIVHILADITDTVLDTQELNQQASVKVETSDEQDTYARAMGLIE